MSEEGPSNSDLEAKLNKQINGLIKLSNDFNNLQIKFKEEKEKSANLEKKNQALENELKEIKKVRHNEERASPKWNKFPWNWNMEFEKQDYDNLKAENRQKTEKINFLEEKIKKYDDLYNKKLVDLSVKLDYLLIFESVNFVKIENKWKEINSGYKCCENKGVNKNKTIGNC